MRSLVTGAAGFIGSHLAVRLLSEGHEVIAVDSFTDYYDISLKKFNADRVSQAGAQFIQDDLNSLDLDETLDGVDLIFHLAGQPGVRASWGAEFKTYTYANIDTTQRLLEACRHRPKLRRLVYASSSSVYGNAERYPTKETDLPQPVSPYGVSKLAAEHLCSLYASNFGVPTVSLRYFTVYGPGQRPDMAFTRFANAALRDEQITLFGTGDQVRDFTYVDDVVDANFRAAVGDLSPGAIFNVAGGSHASINEVLSIFEEVAGKTLAISRLERVAGDVDRTGGDTNSIRSALGWRPSVTLSEGIARQFEWAKELAHG